MNKISIVAIIVIAFLVTPIFATHESENLAKIKVPAVTNEGKGTITDVEIEIVPGKGRILLNTEPFGGIQLQNSERVAVGIAENFTYNPLGGKDVIISFKADTQVVDGPSAGGAITIAAISAILDAELRNDTTLTGTIQQDGSIGRVSSIFEKVQAAHEKGFKFFIIPDGTEFQPFSPAKVENLSPNTTEGKLGTQFRNLTRYAADKWGLKLIPVSDINDVFHVMIEGANERLVPKIGLIDEAANKDAVLTPAVQSMTKLAEEQIANAKKALGVAKAEVRKSKLNKQTLADMNDLIRASEFELIRAEESIGSNYLYSAANSGFRATIYAKTAADLTQFNALNSTHQDEFVKKRKEAVSESLKDAKARLFDITDYDSDRGSYEWAIGAETRLAEAEEEFENIGNSDMPLNAIAVVEGWSGIAISLYNIAREHKTGEKFDTSSFVNLSTNQTSKVEEEMGKKALPPQEAAWMLIVAKREQKHKWHLAAYTDSSIALERIKTMRNLGTRNPGAMAEFSNRAVREINESNSVWAKLYKDNAKISLFLAVKEKNLDYIDGALVSAEQAKVYSEVAEKVKKTKAAPKPLFVLPPEYAFAAIGFLGGVIIYYRFFRKAAGIARKRNSGIAKYKARKS